MLGLNWLDIVFIVIVAGFSIIGFSQGFVKGLISLLTWLMAAVLAYFFADQLSTAFTQKWFDSPALSFWLSFGLIIIIALFAGRIVGMMLSGFQNGSLSATDRLLGFMFGIVRTSLVMSLVVGMLSHVATVTNQTAWQQSRLVPWLINGSGWIRYNLPAGVKHKLDNNSLYSKPQSKVETGANQ